MGNLPGLVSEEANVLLDVIDILLTLLFGVGIVVAQVALSSILSSNGKVESHSLSMANMQISVGLRRESGVDTLTEYFLVLFQKLLAI